MTRCFLMLLALISLLYACQTSEEDTGIRYLHLAHVRTMDTVNQTVDPRLETLDYSPYELLLLGGDLTEESSKERSTLEYLDKIFDLGSPSTLWALGNHDNANNDWVMEFTRRPITFTQHHRGITYVVLYTQEEKDWMCTITGEQLEMLQQVCDTIAESSHLIVMTHKLVWIMDNPDFAQHQGKGAYDWSCNYRIHENNWNDDILPRLREVQNRGTQVIMLAGDIGNNVLQFEEHTSDGLVYLASGLPVDPAKAAQAKALVFRHDPETRTLNWSFVPVDSL
jgi:hypothetical protein